MGSRALGVLATVFAVMFSVISSIYVVSADRANLDAPLDPSGLTWLSFIAAIGAAVMLCWRHQWPVLVCGLTLVPSLLLMSDSAAALVALAALAAARRDKMLWLGGFLVFAATSLAVWRDAGWDDSITILGTWVSDTEPGKVIGTLTTAAVLCAIPL